MKLKRDEAAEVFAKFLYATGVEKTLRVFFEEIDNPSGITKQKWITFKEVYESESEARQEIIQQMLKEVLILSIFAVAVDLDGATGYGEVDGLIRDFSVSVRTYKTIEDARSQNPAEVIEICPTTEGLDVHDHFLYFVDESEKTIST